ncbi:MAG: rhodanese-like domain-containing protein [Burkholderiaceae bacterium]
MFDSIQPSPEPVSLIRRLGVVLLPLLLALSLLHPAVQAAGFESMGVEKARAAALAGSLILVDIRTPDEWKGSGLPDVAVALDMREKTFVQSLLALRKKNPGVKIGLICATGGRSRYVANWLSRNGVSDIVDVAPGLHTSKTGWLAKQLPVRPPDK